MLSDGTWSYTWQHGRQLASMTNGTTQLEFEYNADGLRTSKTLSNETVSDQTTLFHYNGTQLTHMSGGGDTLHFYYDANGKRTSLDYNGATYAYLYNAQGDVVALSDTNGTVVVEYAYDAWGNPLSITGTGAFTIGQKNPFRYRGYFYDAETGLYYLQSRYYSPKLGRFICADSQLLVKETSSGMNLFCYCINNPVNMADQMGNAPKWLKKAWERVKHGVKTSVRLVKRTVEAVSNSISARAGVGVGMGARISSPAMGFTAVAATTNLIELKQGEVKAVNRSYTTASVDLACFSVDLVNKGKQHYFLEDPCEGHGGVLAGGLNCSANSPIETDGAAHLKISFGASLYFLVGGEVGVEMDLHDMAIGIMNVWEEEISNECLYLWSE